MKFLELTNPPALHQDDEGTIRLTGSRVTLDTLISAYKKGEPAELIQDSVPSLSLAQIYSAIAWYLTHEVEAEEYLKQRAATAENLRREIENHPTHRALKDELVRQRKELLKT